MSVKNLVCLILSLILCGAPAAAASPQEQHPDSISLSDSYPIFSPDDVKLSVEPYRYSFHANQLITPGVLIAAGSVGVNCFQGFKKGIRADFAKMRGDHYLHFDDYIQYLTPALYLGLGLCKVPSRYDFVDRLLAGTTAYLMMAIVTNTTKYAVREMRPDSSTRNSFPSGHSATVFTGAELMRITYGNYVGIAGYAVACTVGFMRMYNNRHWYNDILTGAGIGILSARAAYWLLPLERKLFKRDRHRPHQIDDGSPIHHEKSSHQPHSTALSILPYYAPTDHSAGLALSAFF